MGTTLGPEISRVVPQKRGNPTTRRLRFWDAKADYRRVVIILIGGAPSVGKSTLAGMLAHDYSEGLERAYRLLREGRSSDFAESR
jgi:hypothetical protein